MESLNHSQIIYGASVITSDHTLILAPRAMRDYGLKVGDEILLYAPVNSRGKVSIMKLSDTHESLFQSFIPNIERNNKVYEHKGIYMAITRVSSYGLTLNTDLAQAFHLHKGERFLTTSHSDHSLVLAAVSEPIVMYTPYRESRKDFKLHTTPC